MSSVVIDLIYRVEEVPAPGTEAMVHDGDIAPGGGLNAGVAARRAGLPVAYGGAHGVGIFGDIARRGLAEAGIETLQPRSPHGDQGGCVVLVDRLGERTFIYRAGAEGAHDDALLSAVDPSGFDWVLLTGYGLAQAGGAALGRWLEKLPEGPRFVFDPSPVVDQIPQAILATALAKAHWISANASEAALMTGARDPEGAASAVLELMGRDGTGALIRCGADGCWVAERGAAAVQVPGFAVGAVDTNGAGDAHLGNFIAALSSGAAPLAAAEWANAAAALSTTRRGPSAAPEAEETRALLREYRDSGRIVARRAAG